MRNISRRWRELHAGTAPSSEPVGTGVQGRGGLFFTGGDSTGPDGGFYKSTLGTLTDADANGVVKEGSTPLMEAALCREVHHQKDGPITMFSSITIPKSPGMRAPGGVRSVPELRDLNVPIAATVFLH